MRSQIQIIALALLVAGVLFVAVPADQASAGTWGPPAHQGMHCVKYGETLYGIGRQHGVSPQAIAHANGIYNMDRIYAGQCLMIPPRGHPMPAPKPRPAYGHGGHGMTHCVTYGETLYSIGRRYGVSPYAIARFNGIYNPNYIQAGQCLTIPGRW
jgi:LysM repeat protein